MMTLYLQRSVVHTDESFLSSSHSRTGRVVDEPERRRGAAQSSVPVTRSPADFQDLVRMGVITRVLILVYIWIQELRDITPPGCTCHLLFIEIYLPYVFTFFMLTLMRFELLWVCFSITSCFSSYKQHVGLTKGKLTSGFQLESCEERQTFDYHDAFDRIWIISNILIYGISLWIWLPYERLPICLLKCLWSCSFW